MNIVFNSSIDRDEWLAALHAKGSTDSRLAEQMDEAERLLKAAARPKAVYRVLERSAILPDGDVKCSSEGTIPNGVSLSIKKHLEGCHKIVLMAVTLGTGVDQLLRRTQITDMAMAVIIDCGASVMIEQVADEFEYEIRNQLAAGVQSDNGESAKDVFTTSRFSPGYGDWQITEQSRIIRLLDGQRQIGLNVTRDSLMIPRKSITAVMGIADHPVKGCLADCDECVLKDKCQLKKEGKFCGDKL